MVMNPYRFTTLLSITKGKYIIPEMWQSTATETLAIYRWNKSEFCYRERERPGERDTMQGTPFVLRKQYDLCFQTCS